MEKLKGHLGGLTVGQWLFLSDPNAEPLVYCAWWPWGNGQTISIRIGRFSETADAKRSLAEELRSWFGV